MYIYIYYKTLTTYSQRKKKQQQQQMLFAIHKIHAEGVSVVILTPT